MPTENKVLSEAVATEGCLSSLNDSCRGSTMTSVVSCRSCQKLWEMWNAGQWPGPAPWLKSSWLCMLANLEVWRTTEFDAWRIKDHWFSSMGKHLQLIFSDQYWAPEPPMAKVEDYVLADFAHQGRARAAKGLYSTTPAKRKEEQSNKRHQACLAFNIRLCACFLEIPAAAGIKQRSCK